MMKKSWTITLILGLFVNVGCYQCTSDMKLTVSFLDLPMEKIWPSSMRKM